jgi:hypothetical protein
LYLPSLARSHSFADLFEENFAMVCDSGLVAAMFDLSSVSNLGSTRSIPVSRQHMSQTAIVPSRPKKSRRRWRVWEPGLMDVVST